MNKPLTGIRLFCTIPFLIAAQVIFSQSAGEYAKDGNLKFSEENYEGAIDDYTKWIELDSLNPVAYLNRGNAKSSLQDFEGAVLDFGKSIAIDPGSEYAYLLRGMALTELKKYKDAVNDFSKAIRINPARADSYLNRGKADFRIRDFLGALKDLTKAIELVPEDPWPYFYRGEVKLSLKDFKGAEADYSSAIRLDPEFIGAYLNRGKAKSGLHDIAGAIDDFTVVVRDTISGYFRPELAEAFYLRGMANIESGRKEAGCTDLNEAGRLGKVEGFEEIYRNCSPDKTQLEYLLIEAVKNNNLTRIKELVKKGVDVNCLCVYRIPYDNSGYYFTIESCTPMSIASDSGLIEVVKLLLDNGADVNSRNGAGRTPLIGNSNIDLVRLLIARGADVNARDLSGFTPLHLASDKGIVSILLENGADVNARNETGMTPLHFADSINIARLLVEKGADVNARESNFNQTPLGNALINGNLDLATMLINKGADIDSIFLYGDDPLVYAVKEDNLELAGLLVENGADINKAAEDGNRPLHYSENPGITKLLISRGADVNAINDNGQTPLFFASNAGIADLLIRNGASVNVKDSFGNTPLHSADDVEIAGLLIQNGAEVDPENKSGETPLYYAADADIAALLIEKGANVNSLNEDSKAPLFGAVERNDTTVARLLIKKGCKVNIRNFKGDSPLHASSSGIMVAILIENGSDINALNNDGETPLFTAIYNDRITVARALIEHGSEVNQKNRYSETPLFYARTLDAASLLVDKGAEINVRNQDGDSPLHKASEADIARFLIKNGALLEARNNEGQTPLIKAVRWSKDVADVFIEAGADINARDNTGSTLVFYMGYLDDNELISLIEKGADIKIRNNFGLTPLHSGYSVTIDSILIANGADVNGKDNVGSTPLYYTCNPEIIRFLIRSGANVNIQDNNGYTPFMSTLIDEPCFDAAAELLKAGHPVDFRNSKGQTALIITAVESGEEESIKFLLDNGANTDQRDQNGKTALDYSLALGKVKFITLLTTPDCIRILHNKGQKAVIELIKKDTSGIGRNDYSGNSLLHYMVSERCDTLLEYITARFKNSQLLNSLNGSHQTPLLCAIERFNPEFALRLIQAGADPDIRGACGESPLFMAEYRNLGNVVVALKKKKADRVSPAFPVELSLPMGHVGNIKCMNISPDGRTILSGDDNNTIKLWDISTGKEIRTFNGHEDEILCIDISPDGSTMISGSADKTIRLWDLRTGKELQIYSEQSQGVNKLKYMPGGNTFISNDLANNIKIWDIASGKELSGGVQGEISFARGDDLCFSPDGHNFIVQDAEELLLCEISTGRIVQRFARKDYSTINVASFAADGNSFITANDSILELWDINTGKEIRSFTGNIRWIESISFSPDGKTFLTGRGQTINLWDISSGEIVRTFNFPDKWISKLRFLPEGESFISDNYDGSMDIRDIRTGNILKSLKGASQFVFDFDLSKDGKRILLGSYKDIKIADVSSTVGLQNFSGHKHGTYNLCYSPDDRYFLSSGTDSIIRIWDTESGNIICSFPDNHFKVASASFSPDGKTFISAGLGWSSGCKLWNIQTGKKLLDFGSWIYSVRFTSDGKSLLAGGSDTIRLYNSGTGNILRSFAGHSDVVNCLNLAPDGKSFISGSRDETIRIWDFDNKLKPKTIYGHDGEITNLCYSTNGKEILSCSTDKTLKLWDALSGQPVKTFIGHTGTVVNARFHPSGKFIVSCSDDKTIKYWNIGNTKEVATLVLIDSLDWVLYSPDKYYATTKNGAKSLAWVKGTQIWNFDQWDLQYNRPDIVFGRMPDPDTAMIKLYYKAYQKRLKKMGFSESMFKSDFNTPEIVIEKQVRPSQNNVEMEVAAVDTLYSLDRINVWVNDVPVFGVNGISLRDENQNIGVPVRKKINITLGAGENKIEISALNSAGAESLKQAAYIKNEISSEGKNLYFVAISCADYKDNRYNLKYSVKDGRDMARQFAGSEGNFANIFIDTLFNNNAVLEKVVALKEKLLKSNVDDEVILFASGHGLLDDNMDFYFATYDIDFRHPERRGISFDDFENMLDSIPARKKLFLMDACHSGEVDKEDLNELTAANKTKTNSDIVFRGSVRAYGIKPVDLSESSGVSLNNSFELMQELFAGLDKGTGTTVISAAAGKGYALESPLWNNGVFTYTIINGLKNRAADNNKDGIVTISELKDYSIKEVQHMTDGQQKPTARRESINNDWRIW